MSENDLKLDREDFCCRVCGDLPREPVTIPCGHSFCRSCVQGHWDGGGDQPTCPQCRETFTSRPSLFTNAMLETLVMQLKTLCPAEKKQSDANPRQLLCPEKTLRAAEPCLSCRGTCCETHVQPHHDVPQFQKHQLVDPQDSADSENICTVHDELRNCAVDQRKGHEVSPDAESARFQKDLEERRQELKRKIEEKEKQLEELRRMSANAALQQNKDTFTEAIKLLKEKKSSVEQQIKSHGHVAHSFVQLIQDQVKEDIDFWTKQKSDRETLIFKTRDAFQFLRKCSSLPIIPAPREARQFEPETTSFRKYVYNKPQIPMNLQTWCFYHDARMEDHDVSHEPRESFLKHWCKITLDPNTAHRNVEVQPTAAGNPCALFTAQPKDVPDHPDRFTDCVQVLSKEPLTGQCYFEVCPSGGCFIGLAYKSIERKGKGNLCCLGLNDNSWACFGGGFKGKNLGNNDTWVLCPNVFNRVGVYLDHEAGTITTFLMRGSKLFDIQIVETEFSEPLYFGVSFLYPGDRIWVPDINDKLLC